MNRQLTCKMTAFFTVFEAMQYIFGDCEAGLSSVAAAGTAAVCVVIWTIAYEAVGRRI